MAERVFFLYKFHKTSNVVGITSKFWDFIHKNLDIKFDELYLPYSAQKIYHLLDDKAALLKLMEQEIALDFRNKTTYEGLLISKDQEEYNDLVLSVQAHKIDAIQFFKQTLQVSSDTFYARTSGHSSGSNRPYQKLRRSMGFQLLPPILYWLNYFDKASMDAYGGEALYDLPHITKAEPLGEGILIQVGDSPESRLQPGGEEQLFEATKGLWELIKAKQGVVG